MALKDLVNGLGSSYLYSPNKVSRYIGGLEEDFSCRLTVANLKDIDFCLFLGLNLRLESPILNARMRPSC